MSSAPRRLVSLASGAVAGAGLVWLGTRPIRQELTDVRDRIDSLEQQCEEAIRREHLLSSILARGMEGTHNTLDFWAGILHRLTQHRLGELEPRSLLLQHHRLATDVDRARAEAFVMTNDATAQRSALAHLADLLGDAGTADLLENRAHSGDLGRLTASQLLATVATLRERERERGTQHLNPKDRRTS